VASLIRNQWPDSPEYARHLEDLVQAHPEINLEVPKVAGQINACREDIETARSRQPDFESWWREAREKKKKG